MDPELRVGEAVEGSPAQPPGARALQGRYVSVRPVDPAVDAVPLWRASHDGSRESSRMWTYMSVGPFADVAEMRSWLDACSRSEDPRVLTVLSHESGQIGMTSFMNVEPRDRRIEIGQIWYAPSAQRTEANTETAYLMMKEAFDGLGYRRVEWKCDALNDRSRQAALRLGFTFEGVFRKHMVVKGRSRDTAWFSVIDDEWPGVKRVLERWLGSDREGRPPLASLRDPG